MRADTLRRTELLQKMRVYLDVAGAGTKWLELENELRQMNTKCLNALLYRIERALADSFENGELRGRQHRGS